MNLKSRESWLFNKKTLVIISAMYIVLSIWIYTSYEIRFREALSRIPPGTPPGDSVHFLATSYFGLIVAGGILVGMYWIFALKRKRIVALTAVLMLATLAFVPQAKAGYWATDTVIDVLGVADEEMNIMYPQGWERYLGWEIYINDAYGKFMETFGLEFQLRGWISYDSDDSEHISYYMLQEAIAETGFQFQETIYNGYHIDLLMVFTAQTIYDYEGWSPPDWNAMILYYYPSYPRTSFLMHEYTHQFYLEDGVDVPSPPGDPVRTCVMAVTGALGEPMPSQWGPHCTNLLNNNGYKWRFNRTYWVGQQNDAGTGGDAGNDFGSATLISPNAYTGILWSSDTEDWYKFYAGMGWTAYMTMSPPAGSNFDLQLYDPGGTLRAGSYNGADYLEGFHFSTDSSGDWRIRIYINNGAGQYSLVLTTSANGGSGGGGGGGIHPWSPLPP